MPPPLQSIRRLIQVRLRLSSRRLKKSASSPTRFSVPVPDEGSPRARSQQPPRLGGAQIAGDRRETAARIPREGWQPRHCAPGRVQPSDRVGRGIRRPGSGRGPARGARRVVAIIGLAPGSFDRRTRLACAQKFRRGLFCTLLPAALGN